MCCKAAPRIAPTRCRRGWRLALDWIAPDPHYSTFGTASLLKSERFEVDLAVAHAEYFLKIFERRPTPIATLTLNVVATLQGEGGFSTRSRRTILRLNRQLIRVYSRARAETGWWDRSPWRSRSAIRSSLSVFCRIRRIPISQLVMLGRRPGEGGVTRSGPNGDALYPHRNCAACIAHQRRIKHENNFGSRTVLSCLGASGHMQTPRSDRSVHLDAVRAIAALIVFTGQYALFFLQFWRSAVGLGKAAAALVSC